MSKKTLDEIIEIMNAYGTGKTIQARPINGSTWVDIQEPVWNWEVNEYRIKPESHYRPFTYDEALMLLGKIVYNHKYGEKARLITGCCVSPEGKVQILGLTAEQFMNEYSFIDGTPCGMFEE